MINTAFSLLLCLSPSPQTLEREHKDVTGNMHSMTSEREQLREEDQELVKQRAKLEFDVKDLEEGMTEDQKKREQYQKELAQLEGEIRQKQAELNNIMPQYQQHKNQEERLGSRCGQGKWAGLTEVWSREVAGLTEVWSREVGRANRGVVKGSGQG